jgi:hypothetical protein
LSFGVPADILMRSRNLVTTLAAEREDQFEDVD